MINSVRRLGDVNSEKREQQNKNKKTKKTDEFRKFFDQVMAELPKDSTEK